MHPDAALMQRALRLFGQRRLELVLGSRVRSGGRSRPQPHQRGIIVDLVQRAPPDVDAKGNGRDGRRRPRSDRWVELEVLAGCYRIIRDRGPLLDEAVAEGIKVAADPLTARYLWRRYGFVPPDPDNDKGKSGRKRAWDVGPLTEDRLLRATAAIIEALRILRHGAPRPLYATTDHIAYAGMSQDVSDEAPGWQKGDLAYNRGVAPDRLDWTSRAF